MATQTLTAMFQTQDEAKRAGDMLVSELHVDRAMVSIKAGDSAMDAGYSQSSAYEEKGVFGSLKDLFVPDEDRYSYAEGMRRGAVLMTAQVEEGHVGQASAIIERAGALDLDTQEADWRKSGWTGYDAKAHATARQSMTAGTKGMAPAATGQDDTIKVVEERLTVGKRAVQGGSVRVRAYVVERPVEAEVTLRDETVTIERHAVDRVATAADLAAFQERTIEMTETDEVAVVAKEVRVVEEIGIHKESSDRTETVRDTVRKTEVEVEDTLSTGSAGTGASGSTGVGASAANPPGTMASRAVDKTLDTNISGANPGASASSGTQANPPGTMASRAVDKALDTNISGANPGAKT